MTHTTHISLPGTKTSWHIMADYTMYSDSVHGQYSVNHDDMHPIHGQPTLMTTNKQVKTRPPSTATCMSVSYLGVNHPQVKHHARVSCDKMPQLVTPQDAQWRFSSQSWHTLDWYPSPPQANPTHLADWFPVPQRRWQWQHLSYQWCNQS